jgi:hypothetical protein
MTDGNIQYNKNISWLGIGTSIIGGWDKLAIRF